MAESDEFTANSKCLDYTCKKGTYLPAIKQKPNYYQLVYNRNRSPRIYAAEHTGVLERKDRENKEIDFKERPFFNSLNTIVATSTLEMGIDIGTLNTAINNSVPPLTSNFLQRVGRAGRTTGSALITNFAQSKPHDLFYFEEPSDMMEGEIATPGCYLEAKDILFRHFFAYCLDNWATIDPKNNRIPSVMLSLRLLNTDLSNSDFLANRIISYIKANETALLNRFIDFYKSDIDEVKVLDNLRGYLTDETFYFRIKSVFVKIKSEYENIIEKRKQIEETIKLNNLPETDDERKLLEGEKRALNGLKRLIDKRSILEHLTNVGMLPNYAFPETGVTLNAWVKLNKAKASNSIPSDRQFEIVRSSNSAIREFAPDNFFYSQGFKFAILGINTFDWKDADILLKKRFCSNCDHLADSAISNESHCPKCGDASWSSVKNQHVFVKMSSVKSVNTREKSTLDDSSDDRQANNYKISKHLKFDKNSFQGAWGMKDIPFGIEYIKNVDITMVNLGLSSSVDANKITINNLENVPYHGFVTCKYCGKSTSKPHQLTEDVSKYHFGYCKNKTIGYQSKSDNIFEEVFLFKEIKTEALKILLPIQDLESEAQINMFKAGLELGLKKYYSGNPEHLSIINYSEFNSKTSRFDKYLILHDNIPGGTGYLEKLFNPDDFNKVIKKAYHAIKECSCQYKGKDGCYRCIYTYANQSIQDELSRAKAEKLFKKIEEKSNAWENYSTGLGSLSGNGQIEESELEDRFIRSLRNHFKKNEDLGLVFEDFNEDSIVNYKFKITNNNYVFYYVMRPQVELGSSDGVRYRTRSDFYITLSEIEKDGQRIENEEVRSSVKDIAIYLDGYTYHASKENCRFYNDIQKRLAIVNAGNKITWTLTWADLERFDLADSIIEEEILKKFDSLYFDSKLYSRTVEAYKKIPYWKNLQSELISSSNSLERLIWLLSNPLEEFQTKKKIALALSLHQPIFASPNIDNDKIDLFLNNPNIDSDISTKNKGNGQFYILPEFPFTTTDFFTIKLAVRLIDLDLKASLAINEIIDNLDKDKWDSFWQLFNLIQSEIQMSNHSNNEDIKLEEQIIFDKYECLQYHDLEVHNIVKQLIDNNIDFNQDGGYFIEDNGLYAEAMLGFENKKIVIRTNSLEDKKIFEKAGYIEIEPESFNINDIL